MKIIISRTDGIGDVILTLPVAGILKQNLPDCEIIFLGTKYTKPIIELSTNIDKFVDWDEMKTKSEANSVLEFKEINADTIIHIFPNKQIARIARLANIPIRIGTTGRFYNWFNCNKLIPISRLRSNMHEAQLNIALLKGLKIKKKCPLNEIANYYGFKEIKHADYSNYLSKEKINIILHPKTKGSAREWGVDNFSNLITLLPSEKYNLLITGTKEDGEALNKPLFEKFPDIKNLTGKFTLTELIDFISQSDGLIAASTGPLHISAALGNISVGLYAPMKPIHPGRWAPLGKHASYLVNQKKCNKCKKSVNCECIQSIKATQVIEKIESLQNNIKSMLV